MTISKRQMPDSIKHFSVLKAGMTSPPISQGLGSGPPHGNHTCEDDGGPWLQRSVALHALGEQGGNSTGCKAPGSIFLCHTGSKQEMAREGVRRPVGHLG
jgi:hypothetical protein